MTSCAPHPGCTLQSATSWQCLAVRVWGVGGGADGQSLDDGRIINNKRAIRLHDEQPVKTNVRNAPPPPLHPPPPAPSHSHLKILNWKIKNCSNLTMADLTPEKRSIPDDKFLSDFPSGNCNESASNRECTYLLGAHSTLEPTNRYIGKTVSNHRN